MPSRTGHRPGKRKGWPQFRPGVGSYNTVLRVRLPGSDQTLFYAYRNEPRWGYLRFSGRNLERYAPRSKEHLERIIDRGHRTPEHPLAPTRRVAPSTTRRITGKPRVKKWTTTKRWENRQNPILLLEWRQKTRTTSERAEKQFMPMPQNAILRLRGTMPLESWNKHQTSSRINRNSEPTVSADADTSGI